MEVWNISGKAWYQRPIFLPPPTLLIQTFFPFFLCFSNPCAFNTFFATKRLSKSLLGRGLKIVRHQIDTIRFYIFFHCLLGHTHVFRSSEFCNLSTVYTQLLIWRKKFWTAHENEWKSQCWKFGVNFWNVVNVSLDCYVVKNILSSIKLTSNKNVHNYWHHFLARFFMLFYMVSFCAEC